MTPEVIDALTLRSLRLFEAVYQTRNVSRAAELLGIAQPSVSLNLGRLRQQFGDPLFVRVGSVMQPTPRAETLIEPVRTMLLIANEQFAARLPFQPQKTMRRFSLHMTDLGEMLLVPKLVNHLAAVAPLVTLRVRSIGQDSPAMLADGAIDLMIGYLLPESGELIQQRLFDEGFACLARADHPRVKATLTAEQFASENHIVVTPPGTAHPLLERSFERMRVKGSETLQVSGYLAVGATVSNTDLLATVPSRLAHHLARDGNLRVHAPPFECPTYEVRQYWHPRYHNDAGSRWLRKITARLFHHR